MAKICRKRYARIINIDYSVFEAWLNLPKGFTINCIKDEPDNFSLKLVLSCPHKQEYEVNPGEFIPSATPVVHHNEFGIIDKMWNPYLHQIEPKVVRQAKVKRG